mmetsp:Transcript_17038/g.35654  ORF Transcript_17038/g.35654 Transcript_17038/m.35654 type:complete len:88 (+) Transcript_17038:1364-1627(+)
MLSRLEGYHRLEERNPVGLQALVGIIDVFNKDKNYHFLSVLKCAKETICRKEVLPTLMTLPIENTYIQLEFDHTLIDSKFNPDRSYH